MGKNNLAKSKRPPACEERAYVEIDLDLLRETGEIQIVGEPFFAPTITKKVPRGEFEITYTSELFDVMKELGNKKIEILSYILDHKDGSNSLNMTNTELAKATKSSRPTVIDTIKILESANLLRRHNSVLMISPHLMVKGNHVREAWLMRRYLELPEVSTHADIEVEVDGQMSFTEGGAIVQRSKEV